MQVGTQWIDSRTLSENQQELQQRLGQMEKGVEKLRPIVEGMRSGMTKRMNQAFKDLEMLDVGESLPALELFAANLDDDLAKPLIAKIAGLDTKEACVALVRIGLAQSSEAFRQQICAAIRKYPEQYYVPELLSMMAGETEMTANLVMYPNGIISLRTLFARELQGHRQMHQAQKLVGVMASFSADHSVEIETETFGDISYWSNYWAVPISDPKHFGEVQARTPPTNLARRKVGANYVPANCSGGYAQPVRRGYSAGAGSSASESRIKTTDKQYWFTAAYDDRRGGRRFSGSVVELVE
ncbi:MAG: hypothetical protein R3C53_05630 [Pirellulaceae bacterium]